MSRPGRRAYAFSRITFRGSLRPESVLSALLQVEHSTVVCGE
jgi:hypothetical protein